MDGPTANITFRFTLTARSSRTGLVYSSIRPIDLSFRPAPSAWVKTSLIIDNLAPKGTFGNSPWLIVTRCALAPQGYRPFWAELIHQLTVELPKDIRPIPEPLPEGRRPGFTIRGIKGWAWTPPQYLEEIPVLAKYRMNFMMNCYLSMFDDRTGKNEWWLPLPTAKKRAYEEVVRSCQKHGIQFCFCMNPNIGSPRFVRSDPKDLDDLWRQYAWMQSLGVKWFSVSLDDIEQGIDAAMQATVVNEMLHRLRAKDPEAQMIFCPTFYTATAPVTRPSRATTRLSPQNCTPTSICFGRAISG